MAAYDQLLRTCAETSLQCLDLAGEVQFCLDEFYDPRHNTLGGTARIGLWLADKLKDRLPGSGGAKSPWEYRPHLLTLAQAPSRAAPCSETVQ